MTQKQKIEIAMSETREAINKADPDNLTDETRAELDKNIKRFSELEVELRRAIIQEDEAAAKLEQPNEERDKQELEKRAIATQARTSRYVQAAIEHRSLDGREKELNEVLGLPAAGQISMPIWMLLDEYETRGESEELIETRANAITSLTNLGGEVLLGRFLHRLFINSAIDYLGISRETATHGTKRHTVMTAGTTGQTVAPDAEQAGTAAAFTTTDLEPHRLTAGYTFRYEDSARIMEFESRLRADLSMVMNYQQEFEVFHGDAQLSLGADGLLDGLDAAQTQTIPGFNAATHETLFADILTIIDGLYAEELSQCPLLVSPDAYKTLLTEALASIRETLSQRLRREGMPFRSTRWLDINNSGVGAGEAWGFASKANGREGAMTVCTWPSVDLIVDPYTAAQKGQVTLTAIMMHDAIINRKANFRRFEATAA